jgi:hypothetical protein
MRALRPCGAPTAPPPEGLATRVQRMGNNGPPAEGLRFTFRSSHASAPRLGAVSRLDRLRSTKSSTLSFSVVALCSGSRASSQNCDAASQDVCSFTQSTPHAKTSRTVRGTRSHTRTPNTRHIHGSIFTVPYGTRMGACARGATGTTERTSERCTPPRGARACRAARASVRWQRPAAPSRGALRTALRA